MTEQDIQQIKQMFSLSQFRPMILWRPSSCDPWEAAPNVTVMNHHFWCGVIADYQEWEIVWMDNLNEFFHGLIIHQFRTKEGLLKFTVIGERVKA